MKIPPILQSIINVAKAAEPLVAPKIGPALDLGKKVIDLIDHAVEEFGPEATAELAPTREAFEAAVNAHVDTTVDHLRGPAHGGN